VPLFCSARDNRITLSNLVSAIAIPKIPGPIIIEDVDDMRKQLTRLFEVRHILCHEVPRKQVYSRSDLRTEFLDDDSD
jgi:hypothetical protein